MKAYKLFRKRKDGSLGSLFVNARRRLPVGEWMPAEAHHPTRLKFRPFWHCTPKPEAPHLSTKNRVWCEVEIEEVTEMKRPACQGGTWLLAKKCKIIREL